jgi:nitroreductase
MVLDVIKNRQSVRTFKDEMPSDEQINAVLEAAQLSPSWVNVQPWHFIVVKNNKTKSLLAKLSHNQAHVEKAPVVIVCCGDLGAWDNERFQKVLQSRPGVTQERINQILSSSAINPRLLDDNVVFMRTVEQLTYATAYMTLEAHNQELGACVIGAIGNELTKSIPEAYQVVREELNLPQNMFILSFLVLGIPEKDSKFQKARKDKKDIISYEKYGN